MFDLGKLTTLSTTHSYTQGTIIIEEDAEDSLSMFILLQGSVSVYKNFGKPNEKFLASLGPGDFFGEMSLFLKQSRSATVVAKEEVLALEITSDNVMIILKAHPDLSVAIMKALCKRMSDTKKIMAEMGGKITN
ncbi:MAG: cyclic nucleotide-binding domain-containing protein [Defluviitaleaceae bacterium]|nr:cyclic nucleotide-binding domain-containing protein [Defluviitaleaceae bacterium]